MTTSIDRGPWDLTGKVAIVTGGTGGIGTAVVRRLAAQGARIVVHHLDDAVGAAQSVAALREAGGDGLAAQADMRDAADIHRMMAETIAHFGRLDILVNTVAISLRGPFEQITPEAFDDVFGTNAFGTLFAMQAAAEHMADGGRIINFSSGAVPDASPGAILYVGSKAAIEHMTRAVARVLGPRGITANVIKPGATRTASFMRNSDDAVRRWAAETSPLGRLGEPEDIADVIGFLASDAARWITGQVIAATGSL